MVMLVIFSVVFPVLVSVVVWGGLDVPTSTVPNRRLAGDSFTVPTVIVIEVPIVAAVSATAVAMIETTGSAGTVAGAVYVIGVPLDEIAAESVPHPAEHTVPPWLTVQMTPL